MDNLKGCFLMCAGCTRKEIRKEMKVGEYYCCFVDGVLPDGKVAHDTDATKCAGYIPVTNP